MSLTFVTARLRRSILAAIAIYLASASGRFSALAEALPDMRPALVGSGKDALVNLINTKRLLEQGQDHAALFFCCVVQPNGQAYGGYVYSETPGAEKLRAEVLRCLDKAIFIPAVYNHRVTYASFSGTVFFSVHDAKPRLRIFANQEKAELKQESDFIDPQPIDVPGHHYDLPKYPLKAWANDDVPAVVETILSIDASGKLTEAKVIRATPPDKAFEEATLKMIKEYTFLPAFRNGRPVACTVHEHMFFRPRGWYWKSH
jgi:TonB family protein